MNIIEVRDLTKRFGDLAAVDRTGFEVREGEIFGLPGPNGAGKSTLISVITSLLAPDSGEIRINGADLNQRGFSSIIVLFGLTIRNNDRLCAFPAY